MLAAAIERQVIDLHRSTGVVLDRAIGRGRRHNKDLARVVSDLPAGERLLLRALSRDYAAAVDGADPRPDLAELLSPADVVALANASGLHVVSLVPYGALLDGPTPGPSHLDPESTTYRWRRTLSWIPEDPHLLDLILFVERALVEHMPPTVAPRMLVVLEKRRDRSGNNRWLRDRSAAAEAWSRDSSAGLARLVTAETRSELDRLLEPVRARYLGFVLLDVALRRLGGLDESAVLTPARAAEFHAWQRAARIDAATTAFLRSWPRGCPSRKHRGVDTTLAVDYPIQKELLTEHFGLFDGSDA
ncbi:hypothetical protein SAMN04487968_10636 [Nocardioides terrae]|uniref:Uncharacterized protein n=2 Tax=Nocardioides terrae TaxID=574651 RepID=A0A1I1IQ94_9ACTN|nr:hypothetical protein SAMN04487968_10636 [Nocardioides terrae]